MDRGIYQLNTSSNAVKPTPDTFKMQRSMQPTNAHWPKWHQRNDSIQLSFSDTAVPLCTARDLASKPASDCTRGKRREQIQPLNHITQKSRDVLLVPTRNVGSLNRSRTKQPRRYIKIHPHWLHATCLALQGQLNCKIRQQQNEQNAPSDLSWQYIFKVNQI